MIEIGEFRKKIRGVTSDPERERESDGKRKLGEKTEKTKGKPSRSNAERTQYFSIRKSETH